MELPEKEPYCIDFETANWVIERKESYRSTHAMLLTVGIMLCILCAVPAIIISSLNTKSTFADSLSGGLVLVFIAIGVFMIVFTNMKKSSFDKLLSLNGAQTMGGNFANSHDGKVHYETLLWLQSCQFTGQQSHAFIYAGALLPLIGVSHGLSGQ